ncbi:hypothetical protein BgiBS90_020481 [Biomphalaria glabrata]|nr:hypothetical protein BgiBS90_020481 [Biomphalaria glabrata]
MTEKIVLWVSSSLWLDLLCSACMLTSLHRVGDNFLARDVEQTSQGEAQTGRNKVDWKTVVVCRALSSAPPIHVMPPLYFTIDNQCTVSRLVDVTGSRDKSAFLREKFRFTYAHS